MSINRLWRDFWKDMGMMRRSSLGTPSGPIALLLRRALKAVLKVAGRKTYGRRVVDGERVGDERGNVSGESGSEKGYVESGFRWGSAAHSVEKC
jgi:hypothetical protein